jgi:hypothetical protein
MVVFTTWTTSLSPHHATILAYTVIEFMPEKLTKAELINRVERLMAGKWTEEEMKKLFQEISENVPCPYSHIQGYIFHARDNPSPETVVERMLKYTPMQL